MVAYVYMLRCSDGRYYVGSARADFAAIRALAKRRTKAFSSFETRPPDAPQDEAGGGGTAANLNIE
jgi:hypothetical protein